MSKIKRKSLKPYSFRPLEVVGKELEIQAKEFGVNETDIIEFALECFLSTKDCPAREKLWQKTHKYNNLKLKHKRFKT